MRQKRLVAALLGSFGLAALLITVAPPPMAARAAVPQGGKPWAYTILTDAAYPTLKKNMWICTDEKISETATIPQALNKMGQDGWELVSIQKDAGSDEPQITSFYFKR